MEERSIRPAQFAALLWAGVLASAADLLPGAILPIAGRGAWLSVLLATILLWAAGWALWSLTKGCSPARRLREGLGPVFGRGVLIIYIVWGVVLLALRLRLCTARLVGGEEQSGSSWVVLLTVAAMALWMGLGQLDALARAGQVFLGVLLAGTAAVLFLSLSQGQLERLLPIPLTQATGAAWGAVTAAGGLAWGICGTFLLGGVDMPKNGKGWHWPLWSLGGGVFLAIAQMVVVANLGVELAMRLDNPFFALSKSVGVEGAFQRIESLMLSLWVLADLAMCGVVILALRAMMEQVWAGCKGKWTAFGAVLTAVLLGGMLFSGRGALRIWNREIVPTGNLILSGVLLSALWFAKEKCGKKCGKHISCGKKQGRNGRYSCGKSCGEKRKKS